MKKLTDYSYEELATALYVKGKLDGYHKITDKTKWREPVMAEKLGHVAHSKISAGQFSESYGSDAFDSVNSVYAEYKSSAIEDKQIRNLLKLEKNNGSKYSSLKISGVYNGAYKTSAIEKYAKIDHYFGLFYQETCILIIKVNTEEVIRQLKYNNAKRKPGATTNLNSVTIDLDDHDKYHVMYNNKEFLLNDSTVP